MLTLFLLKHRGEGIDIDRFRQYMRDQRPPALMKIPDLERYDLWFPTEEEPMYDSIEALSVVDREALNRVLNSSIAEELHEEGQEYVDFNREDHLTVENAISERSLGQR